MDSWAGPYSGWGYRYGGNWFRSSANRGSGGKSDGHKFGFGDPFQRDFAGWSDGGGVLGNDGTHGHDRRRDHVKL